MGVVSVCCMLFAPTKVLLFGDLTKCFAEKVFLFG